MIDSPLVETAPGLHGSASSFPGFQNIDSRLVQRSLFASGRGIARRLASQVIMVCRDCGRIVLFETQFLFQRSRSGEALRGKRDGLGNGSWYGVDGGHMQELWFADDDRGNRHPWEEGRRRSDSKVIHN